MPPGRCCGTCTGPAVVSARSGRRRPAERRLTVQIVKHPDDLHTLPGATPPLQAVRQC